MSLALAFLVSLANAPFAIAMGAVIVFTLLQVSGLLGLLAGDADDAGAPHEVAAGHEGGAGGDTSHDADGGHEGDQDHDGDRGGAGGSFAAALGFGLLPLSMIWQTFAVASSITGFALNLPFMGAPDGPPLHTLAWTIPGATLVGALAVAGLGRVLGPVLATKPHEATSRAELVGQLGVVISSRVDEDFGEVRIRDKTGHDLRVVCRLAKGTSRSPREQDGVVVVDCDERGTLVVEPFDEGAVPARGTPG